MKLINGLAIFFIMACFASCFDPPEFPTVPKISFVRAEFIDDPTTAFDSLVIYIDFKDGDGDLGIDGENPDYISYPYNNTNYFQENNGSFDTLHTISASSPTDQYDILDIPDPKKGKLVMFRTRKNPLYSGKLPSTFHCSSYEILADRPAPNKPVTGRKLLIDKADYAALDAKVKIIDTLSSQTTEFYQIKDTVYFALNPNHYNIEVDFLVKDPASSHPDHPGYTEFDWFKGFCQTFDGRFPFLADRESSLEGELSYAMISTGFLASFSVKTLKLRIQIKDRTLNKSNVIESDDFTLDQIRKRK
jgi:hypothetical protein